MKAIEILEWIANSSINGAHLNFIEVPEEGACEWQQNEDWWMDNLGLPPEPIEKGRYLYFYETCLDNTLGEPDTKIELTDDYIYLFRVED